MSNLTSSGPLEGITVIETGSRIAAAFSASILAEQGARVIKIEDPKGGDVMRAINPFVGKRSLFFAVEDRNRMSATLNLRHSTGQKLFRELSEHADVLCENFRPGTMERWEIGPSSLNQNMIYARISIFGQDGPYAQRPGVDLMGISYGGLLYQTGPIDLPPVKSSVTVSDHLTAIFVAQAISAALYRRKLNGGSPGEVIDASLYGSILRSIEATIAEFETTGVAPGRGRARPVDGAPAGIFLTRDEKWIVVSAGSDSAFRAWAALIGRSAWVGKPNFATKKDRYEHANVLNEELQAWVASKNAADVISECRNRGIPVSPVQSAVDLLVDPHVVARADLPQVDDHVTGPMRQPAPYPRFSEFDSPLQGAPSLGEHNHEVWCDLLGLSEDDLESLISEGVI